MANITKEDLPKPIEHETDGEDCWCNPSKEYVGDAVIIVHNKVPIIDGPDTGDFLQ